MADRTFEDGVYRSDNAVYFIKENRIIMQLMGSLYKTNSGFMQGSFVEPLPDGIKEQFDDVYSKVKSW